MTSDASQDFHQEDSTKGKSDFICGVIEGFYGRPWTTEQRKDLFRKWVSVDLIFISWMNVDSSVPLTNRIKRWGMDSYVYAPKDDYKHRAYWREMYTVEEADHLTSRKSIWIPFRFDCNLDLLSLGLIAAAKEQNIVFYYALSPGLDMTYSNPKEVSTLKRKLDQVSQFGCEAFALLFDDIEPEMSKADKEVYQSFGHAQVSVTNEVYNHLNCSRFLFCPTQYCSTRAQPSVTNSEYLNTIGSKLVQVNVWWPT